MWDVFARIALEKLETAYCTYCNRGVAVFCGPASKYSVAARHTHILFLSSLAILVADGLVAAEPERQTCANSTEITPASSFRPGLSFAPSCSGHSGGTKQDGLRTSLEEQVSQSTSTPR